MCTLIKKIPELKMFDMITLSLKSQQKAFAYKNDDHQKQQEP